MTWLKSLKMLENLPENENVEISKSSQLIKKKNNPYRFASKVFEIWMGSTKTCLVFFLDIAYIKRKDF